MQLVVIPFRARLCFVWLIAFSTLHCVEAQPIAAQDRVMLGVRFVGWTTPKDPHDDTSVVAVVVTGGPAEKAGILTGDEILTIDDRIILQPRDSLLALRGQEPGDVARVEIRRGRKFMFLDVVLAQATRIDVLPPTEQNNQAIRMETGIVGRKAPEWTVTEWAGLPAGNDSLQLSDVEGKIVYLFFFQSSCESSRREGLSVLREVKEHFADDDSIVFIAIQTAFRAYTANTMKMAKRLFESKNVDIPIGQDGEPGRESQTAKSYDTYGTPWTVIIGQDGIVKYNGFDLKFEQAVDVIDRIRPASSNAQAGR